MINGGEKVARGGEAYPRHPPLQSPCPRLEFSWAVDSSLSCELFQRTQPDNSNNGLVGVRVLTLVSLHGKHGDGMKSKEPSAMLVIGQSSQGALASRSC